MIRGYLLMTLLGFCATGNLSAVASFTVTPAPEWAALFQRNSGWTGADGDFSVALSDTTTLWLFSDTFVGEVNGGHRTNTTMVNNSIALQSGRARPEFFYGRQPDGQPAAFIVPQDGRGYFWLFSGVRTKAGLRLFLENIENVDHKSPFGFHLIGTWLGRVANPDDPPPQWKLTQAKLPFGEFTSQGDLLFGSALLRAGGYVYVYGLDNRTGKKRLRDAMVVARVLEEQFDDFTQWRFYAAGQWQADWKKVASLGAAAASEYSVSYLPTLKQYAAVYSGGISGKIYLRFASAPVGPWTNPLLVYECPEQKWPGHCFCYAGKAHPELSTAPDELLVSYAANSWSLAAVVNDARLYWPRFIRLKFAPEAKAK